jgi:hypothetical protein
MSPILGIWASSRPAITPDTGAMFPLQVITVGPAGASSISFTNIPNTYSHLQLRILARSTRTTAVTDYMNVTVNSDTGANYTYHFLQGDGSVTQAGASTSLNQAYSSYIASDTSGTSIFGVNILDLLDYANTNKYKTFRFLGGCDRNATEGKVAMMSSVWMNTNAITSIQFAPSTGSFTQYSQFALYAVKGA